MSKWSGSIVLQEVFPLFGPGDPALDFSDVDQFHRVRHGPIVRAISIGGIHGVVNGHAQWMEPYRGIGNAVYPRCVEWIARRITMAVERG